MFSPIFFIFMSYSIINNCQSISMDKWFEQAHGSLQNLLNHLLKEMTKKSRCIVFIIDSYYRRLIKYDWQQIEFIPCYHVRYASDVERICGIHVRGSEEFSPPRMKFQNSLNATKNSGCDAYIILMANGLQVSQLLEYAERNRLMSTQGKFLLMYDERLFDPEMRNIWNRIINVLFIHRFTILSRKSKRRSLKEWFNLETVNYPVRMKNFVTTRYVNTWYRGRMRNNMTNYFPNKTQNLKRKHLNVAIFEHVPAVTRSARELYDNYQKHSEKALGVEFEILRLVAERMNFKPNFYIPNDIEKNKWGAINNGSYNGLLGEAEQGNAAFFLGDLHYTLRHFELLDLSYPYNSECLTFLTPESSTENSWKLLIVPFKLYSWIAVILILLLGSCAFHFFALFYQKQIMPYVEDEENGQIIASNEKSLVLIDRHTFRSVSLDNRQKWWKEQSEGLKLFTDIQNSMLYTYSMLLQVSLPRLPKPWALRVFIGWWWLYTILVTVAYRASMTATLANPIQKITIDTLEQLAKSAITVGGWGEDKRAFFIASSDVDLIKIGNKFELTIDENESIARVADGTFGYYENYQTLQEARAKRQLLEEMQKKNASHKIVDDRNLHIMQECVIYMPISIGMDRNSPLKSEVDYIVRRAVETGLVEKWLSDVMEWSKIVEIKYESDAAKALVDLHKLHGALVALGIGYFLGLVALIAEHIHWKCFVMKDPAFDKYYMDAYYSMARSTGFIRCN